MQNTNDDISANEIPRSVLLKICKQVLPPQTAMSSEAKDALLKSTTVFINYLTSVALDGADSKTKLGEHDVYRALQMMELDSSILAPVREAVMINQMARKEKRRRKETEAVDGNGVPLPNQENEDGDDNNEDEGNDDEEMEFAPPPPQNQANLEESTQ